MSDLNVTVAATHVKPLESTKDGVATPLIETGKTVPIRKIFKFELHQLVRYGLVVSVVGFGLMHSNELMNFGAILFPLGLLPLVFSLSKFGE